MSSDRGALVRARDLRPRDRYDGLTVVVRVLSIPARKWRRWWGGTAMVPQVEVIGIDARVNREDTRIFDADTLVEAIRYRDGR